MPTPKDGYFLKDGTRVPGTTTIIGRFKAAEGLLHWAWQQGKDGKDFRDTRDKAATIGTIAHEMVDQYTRGKSNYDCLECANVLDEQDRKQAFSAFEAYLSWAENFKLRIIEREIKLVSETYRYGGTPDAIGIIGNQLVLLDYKTGNAVYSDFLIQLAAYRQLWNENNPDRPLTGGSHLLRFAKEHGDFAHHYYPDLEEAWVQFRLFRRAYEIDKQLKKRAA